jgi:hypothetical protein
MLDAKHQYEMEVAGTPVPPPAGPPLREEPAAAAVAAPAAPAQPAAAPPPGPADAAAGDDTTATPVPGSPPPSAMEPDELTRTLASLADLRDRGAISAEEYERKKADILGRL